MGDTKSTRDGINIVTGEEYNYTIEEVGDEEPEVIDKQENKSSGGLLFKITIRTKDGKIREEQEIHLVFRKE